MLIYGGGGGSLCVCVGGGVCECVCLHKCAYMFNQKHHLCVGVLMCVCVCVWLLCALMFGRQGEAITSTVNLIYIVIHIYLLIKMHLTIIYYKHLIYYSDTSFFFSFFPSCFSGCLRRFSLWHIFHPHPPPPMHTHTHTHTHVHIAKQKVLPGTT